MRTIKRDIVGIFIFSGDDKILLGKAGVYKGDLVVPGGGIEGGETKIEAIKRETMEETGLDTSDFDLRMIDLKHSGESDKVLRDTGEKVHVIMDFYNFTAHTQKKANEIQTEEGDDFNSIVWYPLKDLPKLKLSPPTVTTLRHLGLLE